MAELMELKQMKIRQEDFLHVKDQIYQITHTLEEKQSVLDEVKSERKSLQSELSRYIIMVKQIQKDYELIQQAEAELTKDRDQLSQQLTQLRDHDFNFLKEEVDQLRAKKGLRPLPSLEQEEAEHLGRYLEKRREHWRGDGSQDLAGPSDNTSSRGAPSSSSSSAPIHSHRASGSSSGTRPLRNSASASSIGSSSSNAATSSGRDRGRPGKSHHHSSPGHSRSSSSSGKSKYEVSSSRSARQSQSRSQSPSRPSSSSSANLRAERLKKRSRY
ncbi:hypothetical protein BGZ76_008545 [Entomortierella beljakovae]|nr:hypothetical protein BGZ76_008545 [Entomortierella beljakovae]